jgi:uncharacterized protein (DUF1015 family)
MVAIVPFNGYVYNKEEFNDKGGLLLAPPYDVLSDSERVAFYKSHPHNFLHVDLGPILPEDPSSMSWHERSAELLTKWIKEGILVKRPDPALVLLYSSWCNPGTGERMSRLGFISLMKLEEVRKDSKVRLHEKTFSYHKEERLDLMRKTKAQLSPIFGFIPDHDGAFWYYLYSQLYKTPYVSVEDSGGHTHKMFFLDDPTVIHEISTYLSDTTVYIADGHHRYMTALNYQRETREELKAKGINVPENSTLDYVMTYLCPMSEKGLQVLPTHRILSDSCLGNQDILSRLEEYTVVRIIPYSEGGREYALDSLKEKLLEDKRKGLTVFGLILKDADYCCFVKVKEKLKQTIAEEAPEKASLSLLDVSILTNVILKQALGLTEDTMDDPDCISYVSQISEAYALVEKGKRAAFILNPTSLAEIIKVTESGYVMPRKATYFYPKVSNGLVINLINPLEVVVKPVI